MKKALDMSCQITDKEGKITKYKNLELASKATGLSTTAIKIRCNKPNNKSKDGYQCEWVDIKTKRHFQAKKSKTKGSNFELEIIKDLTDLGYKGLKSSRSENRNLDNAKIDIAETEDKLPFYAQCKATANTPNIEQIIKDCPKKDRPLVIMWKKQQAESKHHEYVMMPKDFFYTLLQSYKLQNE